MSAAFPIRRCSVKPSAVASTARGRAGATARRWSRRATTCAGPGTNSPSASRRRPPASWRSGCNPATGSASGRPTGRNGWSPSSPPPRRPGLILVNINPAYRLSRARLRTQQGRLQGARHRAVVQDLRLYRHAATLLLPELAGAEARPAAGLGAAAAICACRDPDRRRKSAGHAGTTIAQCRRTRGPASNARARPSLAMPRNSTTPINIQFTSGTTGSPKGATLTHHNILNNGYFIGERMRLTEQRPHLHSGAALSLLRHGAGQPRLRHPRHRPWSIPAKASIRWQVLDYRRAGDDAPTLYGVPTMFIAELDHPDFATFDLSSLAHRHHGRRALPDRGDEARGVRDAHGMRSPSPTA
jgi:hypothetical protein